MARRKVLIGLLGPVLDAGSGYKRWEQWRPSVSICQQDELPFDRFEILFQPKFKALYERVAADLKAVSPETTVRPHDFACDVPWDFGAVYGCLHDFARGYPFDTDAEDYYVHITTGTHVAQICLFLLTEAHYFPAKLIQSVPPGRWGNGPGGHDVVDLDLSKYDRLAARFAQERRESTSILKGGIETLNDGFNQLIERAERVAVGSKAPILLTGPTGAGKSQLARRIFELKKAKRQVDGAFVEVNCATLRGDGAMSALFGHRKGAFTGATADRPGLLRSADKGMLFLDEIGELGLDEQAMMLRAIEEKRFLPVGADGEVTSVFQLIAGTNRDLPAAVAAGRFREDLLARINLWTFALPSLRDRPEDLEPNLRYELEQFAARNGVNVAFNREARERFARFATSPEATWAANFRDLNAAVTRMATLAGGGRITAADVDEEVARLRRQWAGATANRDETDRAALLERHVGPEALASIDPFDQVQLAEVIRVCRSARTLSEAGRQLFAVSRKEKDRPNDADRLRKYLARFNVDWRALQGREA